MFEFEREDDRDRILDQAPWSYMGHHMVLQVLPPHIQISELQFHSCSFWIQAYGLPPQNFSAKNAKTIIGDSIGDFIKVDEHSLLSTQYLRFRTTIDIQDPLPLGFFSPREGLPPIWINFKYERLPNFCYRCGRLDHEQDDCLYDDMEGYGPNLRAQGYKNVG